MRRGSSVVEQRIENPCVESSILSPGTIEFELSKELSDEAKPKICCALEPPICI